MLHTLAVINPFIELKMNKVGIIITNYLYFWTYLKELVWHFKHHDTSNQYVSADSFPTQGFN